MNQSWIFRDKSFLWAVLVSLLWHFFWFFSITITVSTPRKNEKVRSKMASLGAVLDDSIFKTLVENRPQLSQTFYRPVDDFTPALDLQAKTIERHLPGDVVSMPLGRKFFHSLKELVGGAKASPDYEFVSRLKTGYADETFDLEGEVKERQILSHPAPMLLSPGIDPMLQNAGVEIEFIVDPSGAVKSAEIAVSSGNPELDLSWVNTLRRWQFSPLGLGNRATDQKGRIKLRMGPYEKEPQ